MEAKIVLVRGVDSFTRFDLLRKAAQHKGLRFQGGASDSCSEPIKVYVLDEGLLATLAKRGIKQQARPDCHHKIFTLVDENPQTKVPGRLPSNYWNFDLLGGDKRKFDLRVTLSVGFKIDIERRGVVFVPQVRASFVSAMDRLPNFRMFKALVESDKNAPAVAKELAASDGIIVVTWTDLGLGGIRRISDLFAEFAVQNATIADLGRNEEVFNPAPYPQFQQPGDKLFVAEPAQPRVIQAWRTQLNEHRACLVA